MQIVAFPACCGANVLDMKDLEILTGLSTPNDKDGRPTYSGRIDKEKLKTTLEQVLKSDRPILDYTKRNYSNAWGYDIKSMSKVENTLGITLAITNSKQDETIKDSLLEYGFIPIIERFTNTNHNSKCTLWALIRKPEEVGKLNIAKAQSEKIKELLAKIGKKDEPEKKEGVKKRVARRVSSVLRD